MIIDGREKQPWNFPADKRCLGTVTRPLKTGDYTIEGFENDFVIERKGAVTELAQNLQQTRFKNELKRLEEFKYPFIICEFTMEELLNFPWGLDIPRAVLAKIRMRGPYLLKLLSELLLDYRVKVLFAGKKGAKIAESLFKRVSELGRTNKT